MKTLRLLLLLLAGSSSVVYAQNPNFSDTTPAAPTGAVNCHWQHDSATPVDISCNIPAGTYDAFGAAAAVSGSGSAHVRYASTVSGVTSYPYADCAAGASATGLTDSYSALNAITSAGGVNLIVDGCFALSNTLNLASSTTVSGASLGAGFIMLPSSNAHVLQNVHLTTPTTSNGLGAGGFIASNQTDTSIKVSGLMLNANATQAVTGANSSGTSHGATPGGQFVYCTNFVGVNGIKMENNTCYDSAAFQLFFSNDSNGAVNYNTVIVGPTGVGRFTDCLHFTGPNTNFIATGNNFNCGDDSIAFNPDDGNYPSSGDANSSYIASYVKWGNQTNMHVNDTILSGSVAGVRALSETSLIDNISVDNTTGSICGIFGSLYPAYSVGTGNYGSVNFDGISVTDTWTCPTASFAHYFIMDGGSFHSLQISHLNQSNPGQPYPLFNQYAAGATGSVRLSDWTVNTLTSTYTSLINTATNPGQLSVSGLNWNDSFGTGSVFSGAYVPGSLTVTNYAGPNLLLASGYSPAIKNGDAFSNTYTAPITYVNTVFNEASSGNLAGTTPATCTNGCTGTWTMASGTDFTYQSGGGVQATVAGTAPDLINTGVTNEVIRYTVTTCTGTTICAFVVRYTDSNNYLVINMVATTGGQYAQMYDGVAGTFTQVCSANITGAPTGNYTVTISGTSISLTTPNGSCSGTTANTGTRVGIQLDNSSSTYKVTALSVKNQ